MKLMTNKKIVQFPDESDRVKHIYETDQCAGCQKQIADDEIFHEIVMQVDEKTKRHIALCSKCYEISKEYGVDFS